MTTDGGSALRAVTAHTVSRTQRNTADHSAFSEYNTTACWATGRPASTYTSNFVQNSLLTKEYETLPMGKGYLPGYTGWVPGGTGVVGQRKAAATVHSVSHNSVA